MPFLRSSVLRTAIKIQSIRNAAVLFTKPTLWPMTKKCKRMGPGLCFDSEATTYAQLLGCGRFVIFAGVSEFLLYALDSHSQIRRIEFLVCDGAEVKQLSTDISELFGHKFPGEPAERPTREPKGFASQAAHGLRSWDSLPLQLHAGNGRDNAGAKGAFHVMLVRTAMSQHCRGCSPASIHRDQDAQPINQQFCPVTHQDRRTGRQHPTLQTALTLGEFGGSMTQRATNDTALH